MRGLPSPPPSVVRVEFTAEHAGALSTCGFWAFLPELAIAPLSDVALWFADFGTIALSLLSGVSTTNTAWTSSRLVSFGPEPFSLVQPFTGVIGAWGGSTPNNCSVACYFWTAEPGKRGRSIVHIGGFPNEFTDDELILNEHGWVVTSAALTNFVNDIDALSRGALLSTTLGVVHRSRHGVPLAAAEFAPILGARPVQKIGNLSRRLYQRRGFPPS